MAKASRKPELVLAFFVGSVAIIVGVLPRVLGYRADDSIAVGAMFVSMAAMGGGVIILIVHRLRSRRE